MKGAFTMADVIMSMNEYKYFEKQDKKLKNLKNFLRNESGVFADNESCWNSTKDVISDMSIDKVKELMLLVLGE